jgi:hypothetical protein
MVVHLTPFSKEAYDGPKKVAEDPEGSPWQVSLAP